MREGTIPVDWFSRQVAQADRTDGGIDTLSTRIAHIRTWTFAANRPDWLADPEHWQGVTRTVEDRLSDALHERLTERFVDRRTSVLMRRLRENTMLETEIAKSGEVVVEGHVIGRLGGFQFMADPSGGSGGESVARRRPEGARRRDRHARRAARRTRPTISSCSRRTERSDGSARRSAGSRPAMSVAQPRVRILADEHLTGASRDVVQRTARSLADRPSSKSCSARCSLSRAEDVTGMARGLAFQLLEGLGVIERHRVAEEVKGLDQAARASLRKYGVRFGAYHVYLPALLKPAPRSLAAQLWALKRSDGELKGLDEVRQLASSGRTSFAADKEVNGALPDGRLPRVRRAGGPRRHPRAARRPYSPSARLAPRRPSEKPLGAVDGSSFTITPAMTSLTGSSGEDFASILRSLGYRMETRPKPAEPPPVPAMTRPRPRKTPAEKTTRAALAAVAAEAAETAEAAKPPESQPPAAAEPPMMPTRVAPEPAPIGARRGRRQRRNPPVAGHDSRHRTRRRADRGINRHGRGRCQTGHHGPGVAARAAAEGRGHEAAASRGRKASPAEPEMIEVWRPGRPPGSGGANTGARPARARCRRARRRRRASSAVAGRPRRERAEERRPGGTETRPRRGARPVPKRAGGEPPRPERRASDRPGARVVRRGRAESERDGERRAASTGAARRPRSGRRRRRDHRLQPRPRSRSARRLHQGDRPHRPSRTRARSELAVRQARRVEGTARGQQGAAVRG